MPDAGSPSPMLPGLDDVGRQVGPQTRMERAARAQLDALDRAGRLNEGHAMLVALILDLCRTVGMGAAAGKAAGVAMASRQLLDAMDKLPPLVSEAGADEWAQVVAALAPPASDDGPA